MAADAASTLEGMLDPDVLDEVIETDREGFVEPMKATLTDDRFDDPGWIFERKLDGVRLLIHARDGVTIWSRNREDLTDTYPEIAEAIAEHAPRNVLLDGEVVAFSGGKTSFSRLQGRMQIRDADAARASGIAVHAYLFDILHWDGHDLRGVPLRDRKRILRAAVDFEDPLRFTSHRNERGVAFYEGACEKGWEGIIAKQAASTYKSGTRSREWLKWKCVKEQEFVIGGFTDPKGERVGFGALLVGVHDGAGGPLRFAGKVGTGFDGELLERLAGKLAELERDESPFEDRTRQRKGEHWVEPELVGQVEFTEWTHDGRLRHPSFKGLRHDKDPEDVVREEPI